MADKEWEEKILGIGDLLPWVARFNVVQYIGVHLSVALRLGSPVLFSIVSAVPTDYLYTPLS